MLYDFEVLKSIPIEDVCREYGISNLTRKGQNLWGVIRNEKTPSFSINPQKNIWRDWGLSVGGDTINLVAHMEGVSNEKAVVILAEKFNISPIDNDNYFTSLPTKRQFEEINIIANRSLSNFEINLEKQSIEEVEKLEEKYSITMYELSKNEPKLYHELIDKKAIPIILNERNNLLNTIKAYEKTTDPILKGFYKEEIEELQKSLNSKIDIYNSSRLDGVTKDSLKIQFNERNKNMEKISDKNNLESSYVKEKKPLIDMEISKEVDVKDILENLKNGVSNIFNSENFKRYLNFQSQFHSYSPRNSLLIALQNEYATRVASFTKWNSMGRTINKGERGLIILAPSIKNEGAKYIISKLNSQSFINVDKYSIIKHNDKYSVALNKKIIKSNLTQNTLESFININKIKFQHIVGFKKTYVFDISQTSGEPVPTFNVSKLNDLNLLNETGFYKTPYLSFDSSDTYDFNGNFKGNKLLTLDELINKIKEYEKITDIELSKDEKIEFSLHLSPNKTIGISYLINHQSPSEISTNLYETICNEIEKVDPNLLVEINTRNDKDMATILAIRNQIESSIYNKGINLEYTDDTGNANGYFSRLENKICVNNTTSLSQQTKTLIHEYVHSELHSDGRYEKDGLTDKQTVEIEAESTAYIVSNHFGFDTGEYSFGYVSSWARGRDVSELEETLKTIKTASEKIINEIKNPLELQIYNNQETVKDILKNSKIKPNDSIINNMIEINKLTGKINNILDIKNADKFNKYSNDNDLSKLIKDTNTSISENIVEVKTTVLEFER